MKYEELKKDGKTVTQAGDEWFADDDRIRGWSAAPVGMRLTPKMLCRYRRPIPEKKAKAVDWRRVARTMARDVRDLLSCRKCGFNEYQKSHIGAGLEVYTRALARARKGAKGGR